MKLSGSRRLKAAADHLQQETPAPQPQDEVLAACCLAQGPLSHEQPSAPRHEQLSHVQAPPEQHWQPLSQRAQQGDASRALVEVAKEKGRTRVAAARAESRRFIVCISMPDGHSWRRPA